MLPVLSFDEVNSLLPGKRSMSFEEYFGDMGLTQKQKKARIRLAERFYDELLFLFLYLFEMQVYGAFNWADLEDEAREAYKRAGEGIIPEESLDRRAEEYAENFVRTTREHEEDAYYYSEDRLVFNAENEAESIHNEADYIEATDGGYTHKTWNTMQDEMVRETHAEVNGLTIPIDELFYVGDSMMLYPKDYSHYADAKEIVNCRCYVTYSRQ